jgi:hypothetical protein
MLYAIVGRLLAEARGRDCLFNVMFHSMEVIAGASPYSPTEHAARGVLNRLARLLSLLRWLGAEFYTLEELAEQLDRGRFTARAQVGLRAAHTM